MEYITCYNKRMARKWNMKGLLIGYIRRCFLYSPIRKEVLANAKLKKLYRCNICKKSFDRKLVTVDHIKPVVDVSEGFPTVYVCDDDLIDEHVERENWTVYIWRMFCSKNNLQVACKLCHKKKTESERKKRQRKSK